MQVQQAQDDPGQAMLSDLGGLGCWAFHGFGLGELGL